MLQDQGREDIDPRQFHLQWDGKMFPFHLHVEKVHRFLSISRIMTNCLKLTFRDYGITVDDRTLKKYVAMTRKSFIDLATLYDDTRPALEILVSHGHDLGVISNADLDLYKQLSRMKLLSFFKYPMTSYEANSYKPTKSIFLKALRLAHCTSDNAVMVGDSMENDIVGASNVGMMTILIDRKSTERPHETDSVQSAHPDIVVNNLLDIGAKVNS